MGVSVILLAATTLLSIRDIRTHSLSRWFDCLLYSAFFLAGCVLTFLIFVSEHEATSPNWLYLWLNPLCLIPVVCIWIKRCRRAVYCYQICNFVALFLLLLIGILGIQGLNDAFYMLIGADILLSARYLVISNRKLQDKLTLRGR